MPAEICPQPGGIINSAAVRDVPLYDAFGVLVPDGHSRTRPPQSSPEDTALAQDKALLSQLAEYVRYLYEEENKRRDVLNRTTKIFLACFGAVASIGLARPAALEAAPATQSRKTQRSNSGPSPGSVWTSGGPQFGTLQFQRQQPARLRRRIPLILETATCRKGSRLVAGQQTSLQVVPGEQAADLQFRPIRREEIIAELTAASFEQDRTNPDRAQPYLLAWMYRQRSRACSAITGRSRSSSSRSETSCRATASHLAT